MTVPNTKALRSALESMILSASGWRGVFAASGGEESADAAITAPRRAIALLAGGLFADYVKNRYEQERPLILTGMDARPTGPAITDAVIEALCAAGCDARYAGPIAAPEIMAWARSAGRKRRCAFVYVSASHNPIGHNGLKFGLDTGGVLSPDEAAPLIARFKALCVSEEAARMLACIEGAPAARQAAAVKADAAQNKAAAREAYTAFTREVITGCPAGPEQDALIERIRAGLKRRPLSIAADFNGSARAVSIDRVFLQSMGAGFSAIHETCGAIAHRIVPEGESLDCAAGFLTELHAKDLAYSLAYMPDCDGDRGNLVIWDDAAERARPLEAQEVFALAVCAELAFMAYRGADMSGVVVAVNDPTSMRVDEIAARFGAKTARAEVGEANVVALAQALRQSGKTVVPLGEGAAGGVIIYPSAVRDPLDTAGSLLKLLALRGENGAGGLFELWLEKAGQGRPKDEWTLSDVLASLPRWTTTGAYEADAVLTIHAADPARLKADYQRIFERDWEKRRAGLAERHGIHGWKAFRYNGIHETETALFGDAGRGGLKILLYDEAKSPRASLWMRGSGTEPVLRVMADVKGACRAFERELLYWQRDMVLEADGQAQKGGAP